MKLLKRLIKLSLVYIVFSNFFCLTDVLYAQDYQKRELRGAWIATVNNIDWPSKAGLTTAEQKQEFIEILEMHKKNGMNTIVMQVRPCADAFYPSEFELWSVWLTGEQGKAPEPYYDPLQFMIEETHKRCMEFHAWFNPYRVLMNENAKTSENHVTKTHPEWLLKYGKKTYFDPALPETRIFVSNVIADVVRRYDIDAVHFDDYFYPYKIKGVDFPDTLSFINHSRGFNKEQKDNWRRDNVNLIIKMLHDTIKSIKPYVKFGISPFGIWRNKKSDPRGSETMGGQNYDDLYADVLLWLEKGWIDYVVPQIYWHIGKKIADYEVLAKWWNKNSYGRHLYIGHGIYRMDKKSKTKAWQSKKEIPRQLDLNKKLKNIEGSIYFTTNTFKKNPRKIAQYLKKKYYKYPALVPVMYEIDSIPPSTPINLQMLERKNAFELSWKTKEPFAELDKAKYFVLYISRDPTLTSATENIYLITCSNQIVIKKRFFLFRKKRFFYMTAVDRIHNESLPTKPINIKF